MLLNQTSVVMRIMIMSTSPFIFFSKFFRYLILTVPLLALALPAEARWATIDDIDTVIENFKQEIYVRKDGTYTESIEKISAPLKESGKDKLVHFPLNYNASSSTLKIIEAKTIDKQGKAYPVDPKQIEDKPLASSPQGFDQTNQILIAFPNVSLDSKVFLKYKETVQEPVAPGFFSTDLMFAGAECWKSGKIQITSELPLFLKTNDPEHLLTVKQSKAGNLYKISIQLNKPILKSPVDENFSASNGNDYPWVTLSTLNTWAQFGDLFVKRYEAVTNQPLPALFEKIAAEAQHKTTLTAKINTITMRLAENISYMGDWRSIKGGFIPRDLAVIAKTKMGDCKDFSASTTAILRKMGINAQVALVHRGPELKSPNDLPTIVFNHAFVRVQGEGKTLWIDPTNFSSFAQGLYPDIAQKRALVLNPKGCVLEETPSIQANDSVISLFKQIILPKTDDEPTTVSVKLLLKGASALELVGADLQTSKDIINRFLINAVTNESRAIDWKIEPYNLGSRIVEDLNFQFTLKEQHSETKTTAGKAVLLTSQNLIPKLLTKTKGRVTGLNFDTPGTYKLEQLLPKVTLVGQEKSSCTVDSPWFLGTRTIQDTPQGIQVLEEYVVKKDKISLSELQSKEYADFQTKVYSCFGDTALVYKH
jgi:hypothetical protein